MTNYRRWAERLADVSAGLMESDHLQDLLTSTLYNARELTRSDAGTIYRTVETDGEALLRFEASQNDSLQIDDETFEIPLDQSSLAGWVAVNREPLFVEDAYDLPDEAPYHFDPSFDEEHGYRTQSMLTVPLLNPENEVEGVLQLINRKQDTDRSIQDTNIVPYPADVGELVVGLASVAAAAIQRSDLEQSLEDMIDSMIETLVTALDERDQITTGHSQRLARLTERLVEAINQSDKSRWKDVYLGEARRERLRYSALLHDIGKIAVPEHVLNKQNRLSDDRILALHYRFQYLQASEQNRDLPNSPMKRLRSINESGFLTDDQEDFLRELREKSYEDEDGEKQHVLREEEFRHLSIKRGNLTETERETMADHARQTRLILNTVEWTEWLENVPAIASMHHEKLDGTGYPEGRLGKNIPLDARILAVGDIYEALTARDRPYRDPMSVDEARNVLEEEADEGTLDADLVELFFAAEVYRLPEA